MPTPYDRALDELGKTRSDLATYKKQNAEQQRRIRELTGGVLLGIRLATGLNKIAKMSNTPNFEEEIKELTAILKGK